MANFTNKWKTPTNRATGIAAQAIAAGANYLGSEIDNLVNLDQDSSWQLNYDSAVSPAAGSTLELYILYDFGDAGVYEEGDAVPTDPIKPPLKIVALEADTDTHYVVFAASLLPHPFKVLVKSESNQSCTVTVLLETHPSHATQD